MVSVSVQSGGEALLTTVNVKSGRKKLYENQAHVVEAFREKYIKVDLVDEDDHYFKLNWNGEQYEGNFFGTTLTCHYDVVRDFKTDISTEIRRAGEVIYAKKSNGGRPNRYKE